MSQEPIPIIKIEPATAGAAELAAVLARSGQMEMFDVSSADEARQVAEQFLPCVLLISLPDFTCGHAELALVKRMEKAVRAGRLKVIVLSAVKKHPLGAQFAGFGVTDFVEEPAPLRSLLFKANLAVKGVLAARRRNALGSGAEETLVFKSSGETAKAETTIAESKARYKPALQLGEDTFVFRATPPRKIGKKFTLEAEGPGPEEGAWAADEPKVRGGKRSWRWKGKEDPVTPERDGWIHEGDEPVFDPVSRKWQLRSEKPSLVFHRNGLTAAAKVETDEHGEVTIAEDSDTALLKLRAREEKARDAWRRSLAEMELEPGETPEPKEAPAGSATPEWQVKLTPVAASAAPETSTLEEAAANAEGLPALKRRQARASRKGGAELVHREDEAGEPSAQEPEEQVEAGKPKRVREAGTARGDSEPAGSEAEGEHVEQSGAGARMPREKGPARARRLRLVPPASENGDGEQGQDAPAQAAEKRLAESRRERAKALRAQRDARRAARAQRAVEAGEAEGQSPEELSAEARPEQRKAALKRARQRANLRRRELAKASRFDEAEERADAADELEQAAHEAADPVRAQCAKAERKARASARSQRREKRVGERAANEAELDELEMQELDEQPETVAGGLAPVSEHEGVEAGERQFRAIDSIEEGAGEVLWENESPGRNKAGKKGKNGESTKEVLVPRPELLPVECSWEACDGLFAFIPNFAFASGFGELSELLPLWIQEGESEPLLNEAEDHWRFRDHGPRQITTEGELPASLLDFLLDLKSQADLANGANDPEVAERWASEANAWAEERGKARERLPGTPEHEANARKHGEPGSADYAIEHGAEEKSREPKAEEEARAEEAASDPDSEVAGRVERAASEEQRSGEARLGSSLAKGAEGAEQPEHEQRPERSFRFKARELLGFVALSDLRQQASLPEADRRRAALAPLKIALGGLEVQWRDGRLVADGCDERERYVLSRFEAACSPLFERLAG